jgi:hypothetical protein
VDDTEKIIPIRRIPVLTQAEIESIRTPGDITRIVQAQPDREYQLVRGGTPETGTATESPGARKRRQSAILQVISLGAAGYAFGISSASCILHLTAVSATLVTLSAAMLLGCGGWAYRGRR